MSYDLYVERDVHTARDALPGNMRHRVRRAISDLAAAPRPAESVAMDTADLELRAGVELRRIRMDRWRIIYAVCDEERWVWVLAARRRPPYDYDDLPDLIARLS